MKDIHREFIMGHALEIKGHYFDWESNKKEILLSYIQCGFNRHSNNVHKELTSLKEDSTSKDGRIKELEEKLRYFESPQFSRDLIAEIKTNGFQLPEPAKPKKVLTKVIRIGDAEAWKKLTKEGYTLASSDDEYFVMEKEEENLAEK